MTLLPGDLIACGTSVGIGVGRSPISLRARQSSFPLS